MSEFKKIGTVETLLVRVYSLDPVCPEPRLQAIVPPGVYPLYSDGWSYLWIMEGELDQGNLMSRGDGMFTATQGDMGTGIPISCTSRIFGPDQWEDFVANDAICLEGNPVQRLRIKVEDPISS